MASGAAEETKDAAAVVGCLELSLPAEAECEFRFWRRWVLDSLPKVLQDGLRHVPEPHVTLMFDCAPKEQAARAAVQTAMQTAGLKTLEASAVEVRAGTKGRVLLLYLDSPSLKALFTTLFKGAVGNPKGSACRHDLFPEEATEGNPLGYSPHLTLAWFDEKLVTDSALQEVARELQAPKLSILFDVKKNVVFSSGEW